LTDSGAARNTKRILAQPLAALLACGATLSATWLFFV
jgi:hypothetical protein